MAYEHGLLDRLLGCGTLVISDASERGQVRLPDIPQVEQVHLQISDLLYTSHRGLDRPDDDDSADDDAGETAGSMTER